ncbi:MAG TPA: hypothetical protein VJC05_02525 [Candidatus Andersenbacteria bacterium]|nr:hypothetical protein [Candidatus Andersenbacteria bacterium]
MKCHKYWPPLEDDCPSWTWIGVIEFLNGFGVTITTGPTFTNPNGCWEVFGLLPNGEYDGTLVGALDSDGPAQYLTFEVMAQRISTVARAAA